MSLSFLGRGQLEAEAIAATLASLAKAQQRSGGLMTRTVFVIGAGASIEFAGSGSMPIGSELAVQIEQLIDNDIRMHNTGGSGPVSSAIMQIWRDE